MNTPLKIFQGVKRLFFQTLAGVFRVLTASDIPTDGKNDITGSQAFNIFGSTEVEEVIIELNLTFENAFSRIIYS